MSHIQYLDELIKEYLLFRGFPGTLKAFDNDLKNDKDKGFRDPDILPVLQKFLFNMSVRLDADCFDISHVIYI
ncbi:hypothetical protein BC332_34929 [Capsicum chinense]|nr:hypothetical protein BC332_34929 [Capsicum chinense]